jgi:hypothetical protein
LNQMNEKAQKIIAIITAPYILILGFNFLKPFLFLVLRIYLKILDFNPKDCKDFLRSTQSFYDQSYIITFCLSG